MENLINSKEALIALEKSKTVLAKYADSEFFNANSLSKSSVLNDEELVFKIVSCAKAISTKEAFESHAVEMGFCLDQSWCESENPYKNKDTRLAYGLFKKGWQASAGRKPKANRKIVVAIERMVEQQVEASGMDSNRLERLDGWTIFDAMIEAWE